VVRRGIWLFPGAPAPRLLAAAEAADEAGLDEFWLGDEGPMRDAFAVLAAAAARTRRIRLGVGITNPYLRHPVVAAAEMMTIHELSGGRAVLGLGPGGRVALAPAGVERTEPLARARAALRTMRAVTRGERGHGYEPEPNPFTAPTLPLYIGSRAEQFNRLASAEADGVFLGGIADSLVDRVIGWAHSVRPIAVSLYYAAVFSAEEREAYRPHAMLALGDTPRYTRERFGLSDEQVAAASAAYVGGDEAPARALISDDILADLVIAGAPDDVGAELARRARRHGADSVGFTFVSDDPEEAVATAAASFKAFDRELA
jgi:5,10-methylenetetrahydromethanopterin reductase